MNKYNLLNKVVLFICQDYIVRTVKDGSEVPPLLTRLSAAITGYKQFHMFSQDEAKIVLKLAKSDEITDIMNKEVSFIVFTMELMKLWITTVPKQNRPHLNISDKHFRLGGKVFWQQMMKLKQVDTTSYKHKTEVIDDSITVANEFFNYHVKELT